MQKFSPTAGAIAAGHPATAKAGRILLEQGGNAFDAAVAASLAACVVEPMLTSLGGGGFLLAHPAEGKPVLFDFFTQTPQEKRADLDFREVQVDFGDATQDFHVGLGSIAVPGQIAGLFRVHKRLGRLPIKDVFAPAIALARNGVTLNAFQAYCIKILTPILTLEAEGRDIYQPQGKVVAEGDCLGLPQMAAVLEQLADEGPGLFYRGELGEQLVKACADKGGLITQADLEQYEVMERSPLSFSYRNHKLLTNPPPSSGGALIAFALALLEDSDLQGFGSPAHLNALVQAMRLTNLARQDGYDEQIYDPAVAECFLSQPHLQQYRSQMLSQLSGNLPPDSKLGSTTHISVIDGDGNAASVTASNGEGSSYFISGTGIMLNNMLGEADLNPQGFHQWQPNRRLSSMMAPTLVVDGGKPTLCLGSGGSNRIRTAILQVLLNKLDLGMPLPDAVEAPRVHWEKGILNWEPGWDGEAISACSRSDETVIPWSAPNMFFGGVHGVGWNGAQGFEAVGDFRRCGAFEIVDR